MSNGLYAAIAQGGTPIQIENPLNQMARLATLQQTQTQNEMLRNQLTQEQDVANYLRRADLNTPEGRAGLRQYGKTGLAYEKLLADQEMAKLKRQELEGNVRNQRMKALGTGLTSVMDSPTDDRLTAAFDQLDATGVDTRPFRQQFAAIPDIAERTKILRQYVTTNPEGRAALEFVQPKPAQVNQGGRVIMVDINPNSATYGREIASFAMQPKPPSVEAQERSIRAAGRSVTNVSMPPQERAEQGERGKLLVQQYGEVSNAARLASRTLPSLDTQANILDKGFKTGFGTDVQKAGASVLASLGVPEAAKFATDAQTFLAATQQAVLQRQLEQKGPQTEADATRITQTGAQLGNTPEANRFIIDVAKAQLKRDIEQRNFYDKWWKQNKTYDGAEDAWFSGEGGKSLFDRPELKRYVAPAAPTPGAAAAPARRPPAAPSAAPRAVVRTGTLNGRKVVEYSDGSVEYAN